MCGIVGVCGYNSSENHTWLKKGTEAIRHRGPDNIQVWFSENNKVGFGHARLAIIDLSNESNQPFHRNDLKLSIVFNGEIYNFQSLKKELQNLGYHFHTKSDTEVILLCYYHWGKSFLNKLNGAFAFAILDSKKNIVLLARDRSGEKPLFYHFSENTLYFASELKSLFENKKLPRKLNYKSFNSYLRNGFIPGKDSIIENFFKLPSASYLEFNLNNYHFDIDKYWSLPEKDKNAKHTNKHELLEELDYLLYDSVSMQLNSDVPIGILLSGGVDSSLITAMAARTNKKIQTFSVGFHQSKFNELPHAKLIADHFGTKHEVLFAEESSVDLIEKLAHQFDEPIIDSSMIPTYLVSKLVKGHCKVALGGDGGDELFGGYSHYSRLINLKSLTKILPNFINKSISNYGWNHMKVGQKYRNYLKNFISNNKLPNISEYFDKFERKKLLKDETFFRLLENESYEKVDTNYDLIENLTRSDFNNYLKEDILVKVDRSSMLNSLEIRAPFLDYRLIEFAFSKVPSKFKTTSLHKKILLKDLSKKILPKNFDSKRKQGFSIPLNNWLKNKNYKDLCMDTLMNKDSLFSKEYVEKLYEGLLYNENNGERLFSLILFEIWRKKHDIKI